MGFHEVFTGLSDDYVIIAWLEIAYGFIYFL